VTLAQNRYYLFSWWLTSLWSADAQLDGICYSNGAYFERGSNVNQVGPQLEVQTSLMDRMLDAAVKDIRALKLTDTERVCLFAIAFFSDVENIGLSKEGLALAAGFHDLFVRVLHNAIVQHLSQTNIDQSTNVIQVIMRKQSDASLRAAKILWLASTLKTLVSQCPNEGKLDSNIVSRVYAPPSSVQQPGLKL
jgi:hypothetical protein